MKRYSHYWWPLTGNRFPSRIAVIDADAEPASNPTDGGLVTERLTRWHICALGISKGDCRRLPGRRGDDADSAWNAITGMLASRDRTWLFLPNSGRMLALLDFWRRLEEGAIQLSGSDWKRTGNNSTSGDDPSDAVCVIEDPPTVILCEVRDRPGKLLVLDVRNYGISLIEEDVPAEERCQRYASGLRDCIETLASGPNGGMKCTAGSQAIASFRTSQPCVRLHCHVNEDVARLERASLYGGRCECYRIGDFEGEFFHLDIRNMYPSIAREIHIPLSLRSYSDGSVTTAEISCYDTESSIADATISATEPSFPLRRGGNTIYPVGNFRTVISGAELHLASQAGCIRKIHAIATYTTSPYLGGYFRHWLARLDLARQRGREIEAQWIKAVMVALIGKFAEPGRRWEPHTSRSEAGPYGLWTEVSEHGEESRLRNIAWKTQIERIYGESYWSVPAVASFITARARTNLYHLQCIAGRDNVWYCDTDSLITNRRGMESLLDAGHIRNGEAGFLRVVGRASSLSIYGLRHYALDQTIKCAGVKRGSEFSSKTEGVSDGYVGIARALQLGLRPDGRRTLTAFELTQEYHHGVVGKDGTVTPIRVDDE